MIIIFQQVRYFPFQRLIIIFYNLTQLVIDNKIQKISLLNKKNGFDHCFILDNALFEQPKVILKSIKNQVSLSVYTDQLAIQLYSGFYLSGHFKSYQGLCLEAQNYTDAENNKHFPSNVLKPNHLYQRKVIFGFSSIDELNNYRSNVAQ